MKIAAIYARVSSDQQKEEKTIASQTAALIEFARQENYQVPDEWVFEDEGYSGAQLIRPGLERIRDLAAEGQIQAVLALSPDRLSRKYAYQVLLTEELARHGVDMVFIKAPHSGTPEDQLLLQFQGMIAEYERAQILERSRRGKRHRAKQGEVSVLSGAPYGYRYIRKTDESASARKIYYYRCTGSDAYRHGGKALCDEKPIRQDLLDQLVWNEILHLLENPTLIQNELNRRLEAARDSSPSKRRMETLNRDLIRVRKSMERLLTAYQEELLTLDELRVRMPPLRQREQAMQAELQAINHQTADRAAYLQLAETLTAFLQRLRSNADTLDIGQRQRIMRLLVKEVIVGKDLITIKHSIPGQAAPTGGNPQLSKLPTLSNTTQIDKSYPLCKGRDNRPLWGSRDRCPAVHTVQNVLLQVRLYQL
jgi:DNA invertase Pin-like site-specific DNA recombinase